MYIYRERFFFFPKKDNISFFSCPDGLGFIWLMLILSLDESEKWKSCQIICDPMDYTVLGSLQARKNTGVGSLSLPQGIFSTQRSNPGLPHCRQILYQLSHQGSPRILEWVAYPFSRGYSWPRNWTGISCIAGRFFTSRATRRATFGYLLANWSIHFKYHKNRVNLNVYFS